MPRRLKPNGSPYGNVIGGLRVEQRPYLLDVPPAHGFGPEVSSPSVSPSPCNRGAETMLLATGSWHD